MKEIRLVIAIAILAVSLVAVIVSVGIPYWMYSSYSRWNGYSMIKYSTATGLWQKCFKSNGQNSCISIVGTSKDWWNAVRALEIIGIFLGMVASVFGLLVVIIKKKSRRFYIGTGVLAIVAGACVAVGFIIFIAKTASGEESYHAGLAINVIGCVGLLLGGVIFLCSYSHAKDQSPKTVVPVEMSYIATD